MMKDEMSNFMSSRVRRALYRKEGRSKECSKILFRLSKTDKEQKRMSFGVYIPKLANVLANDYKQLIIHEKQFTHQSN